MKKTKKDKYTNVAGAVMAVSGAIAAGGYTIIPTWGVQMAGLIAVACGAYIAYMTGKDSEGKPKITRRYP